MKDKHVHGHWHRVPHAHGHSVLVHHVHEHNHGHAVVATIGKYADPDHRPHRHTPEQAEVLRRASLG